MTIKPPVVGLGMVGCIVCWFPGVLWGSLCTCGSSYEHTFTHCLVNLIWCIFSSTWRVQKVTVMFVLWLVTHVSTATLLLMAAYCARHRVPVAPVTVLSRYCCGTLSTNHRIKTCLFNEKQMAGLLHLCLVNDVIVQPAPQARHQECCSGLVWHQIMSGILGEGLWKMALWKGHRLHASLHRELWQQDSSPGGSTADVRISSISHVHLDSIKKTHGHWKLAWSD